MKPMNFRKSTEVEPPYRLEIYWARQIRKGPPGGPTMAEKEIEVRGEISLFFPSPKKQWFLDLDRFQN